MSVNQYSLSAVSVLTAFRQVTVKTYFINDAGALDTQNYGKEKYFTCKIEPVFGIDSLAKLVDNLSTANNKIIIRGQPKEFTKGSVQRDLEHYQEPSEGLSWAMLDFDKIPLPEGLSPTSIDAIDYVIDKLPQPFHHTSYFYQFSSSTGIVKPDGTSLKSGLNVHLFFWFSRPVTGAMLKAYLMGHCIGTKFFERTFNRRDQPLIRYGVDMALFNAVQPHYIAAPIIKPGVTCTLDATQRQRLVRKPDQSVVLPDFEPNLIWQVEQGHRRIFDEYKRACGWVKAKSVAKANGAGVAVAEYYRNPNPSAIGTDRQLTKVKITTKTDQDPDAPPIQYARLYFTDEGSPGSWYVKSTNPTIAVRYGDYQSVQLRELSLSAHAYVSETLGWFREIPIQTLPLNANGFLPGIDSFARATNCLILAPTGSGKTTAFCQFAAAHQNQIIIYAAQTIALTRQMEADLLASSVPALHYSDFSPAYIHPGVFITTNKSLGKIVEAVIQRGADYWLVIDEAHIALDDFMKSDRGNRLLERAMTRAERTLFMTATLTDVQLKKLTELVSIAAGDLTTQKFGYYQFQPVKQNPLLWANMANFWRDFVALFRHYKALKDKGQDIPRTIIIAPTSKLEPFRFLLESFDLTDQAEVVSRLESVENEIEDARVGAQPILISSPLFALGLNFNSLPTVFWTYFGHLSVDESQIIQTVNRANRDANPCEVRLYAGKLEDEPYRIPNEAQENLRIREYFSEEASLEGLLDSHFQIDRLTYQQLREGEKVTAKALYRLKTDNAIQNYSIVETWDDWLSPSEDDQDIANSALAAARVRYDEDISSLLDRYEGETQALLLDFMGRNYKDSQDFRDVVRLKKEFQDIETALSMALARTDDVRLGKKIDAVRLRRLFGDVTVFLSSQFEPGRYKRWMETAAEKTGELVALILMLEQLKSGAVDGVQFGWAMRKKLFRRAIIASASNHNDYIKWEKHLDNLDANHEEYRQKAGVARREKLDDVAFTFARVYLRTIGVHFDKTKGADGYTRNDPQRPVVPDWNFTGMAHRLLVKAAHFLALPKVPAENESNPLAWLEERKFIEDWEWGDGDVSNELCRLCVHCEPHFICALGRPIQPDWRGYAAATDQCNAFKKVPAKASVRLDLPASDE